MRSFSMTRRLMIWLTVATAVFWIAAAALGAAVMREEFDEHFDSALTDTAERLMPLVVDDLYRREASAEPYRIGTSDGEEYLSYQVLDRSGRLLMHSYSAPTQPFGVPLVAGFADTATHRVYTAATVSDTIFLQVADPLAHRREAMTEGALALVLPLAILAPANMFAVWWLVRRTLSPVVSLRREIESRGSTNLEPLKATGLPEELEGIAGSVDTLLSRLRAALDAERHLAANSAHELRTPIAGALAQAQRLVAELTPGPERERALAVALSLSSLARLAEKLLQLSRADAGIGSAVDTIDLVPVARLVAEEFTRTAAAQGRLRVDLPEGLVLTRRADPDAFAIALRNLVENALAHGSGEVVVSADSRGFSVRNGGPCVPADKLVNLTRRYQRGAGTAPGAGLGLAIADALTRQMGGHLELASPAPGMQDGFRATIVLG